jgi:hypothetical protein
MVKSHRIIGATGIHAILNFIGLSTATFLMSRGKWLNVSNPVDGRAHFFTAQADAILRGRFNVDPFFLSGWGQNGWHAECFIYGQKCFGYFGITPALFRIPFLPFSNHPLIYQNPFWFILLAFLIYAYYSNKIIDLIFDLSTEKSYLHKKSILIITIYAGPLLFLLPCPYMYYESILWAVATNIASLYYLILFARIKNFRFILLSVIFCFFSLHSRVVEGFGNLMSIFLAIIWLYRKTILDKSRFIFTAFMLFLIAISLPLLNFYKFGEISPNIPNHHGAILSDPLRGHFYKTLGVFRLTRIPKLFLSYFFPNFHSWRDGFAFVPHNYSLDLLGFKVQLNSVEQSEYFSPFTSTFFCTTFLAVIGLRMMFRRMEFSLIKLLTIGSFSSVLIICAFIGASERYVSDLWIPLFLLSVFGISQTKLSGKRWSIAVWSFLVIQTWQAVNVSLNFWNFQPDIPKDFFKIPLLVVYHRYLVYER